ncbi:MAG TPA: hypothetical protein VFW94_23735 [Candidatus Acidoferrales bacterium]|nr:hypothetical protein [Candidatus Acidoferrales bacterium]
MATRITKETLYLRHEFTSEERLQMGTDLAEAYNRQKEIDEDEKAVKAQFAERRTGVIAKIGQLSRNLSQGFDMRNVDCRLSYDDPHVGEITYYGPDGVAVKTRAMTETERQMEMPFSEAAPPTEAQAEASVQASQDAVDDFFGRGEDDEQNEPGDESEAEEEPEPEPVAAGKSGPAELQSFHEKELEKQTKRGRKKTQVN